jgi:LPXTG-site transpeptidase (sortase) family protein
MRTTWTSALMTTLAFGFALVPTSTSSLAHLDTALLPNTANSAATTTPITIPLALQATTTPTTTAPKQKGPYTLSIPTIGLATNVIAVGLNAKGEMDVPSGKTNDVGWYKSGTKPGVVGSAVFDAHVFAAFKKLADLNVGDSIYVKDTTGQELHFVVEKKETTALAQTSTQKLFAQNDKARLNLITCAGTFIPRLGTYDHRLIVYAVLAS